MRFAARREARRTVDAYVRGRQSLDDAVAALRLCGLSHGDALLRLRDAHSDIFVIARNMQFDDARDVAAFALMLSGAFVAGTVVAAWLSR